MPNVTVKMSQHIGAPAVFAVKVGDIVKIGDVVGNPGKGLSVAIHAPISGKVISADNGAVTIQRGRDGKKSAVRLEKRGGYGYEQSNWND